MTKPLGRKTAQAIASARQGYSRLQQAVCVSVDWESSLALVNAGGGVISVPMAGDPPIPQRECWIGFLGQQPVCLGPVARPATGVIAGAAVDGLVPVTGDDGVLYNLAYDAGVTTWTTGTRVLIYWPGGGTVLFPLSADPFTHDDLIESPTQVTPSGPTQHVLTFRPVASGSQAGSGSVGNGAFWTEVVRCGDTQIGGYFYDNIDSAIPDNAHIDAASVFLFANSTYGNPPTLGLHALPSKAGALSVTGAVTIPGGTGSKDLIAAGLDVSPLINGAAKGLATHHGGNHLFAPWNQNGSGVLTITATW